MSKSRRLYEAAAVCAGCVCAAEALTERGPSHAGYARDSSVSTTNWTYGTPSVARTVRVDPLPRVLERLPDVGGHRAPDLLYRRQGAHALAPGRDLAMGREQLATLG